MAQPVPRAAGDSGRVRSWSRVGSATANPDWLAVAGAGAVVVVVFVVIVLRAANPGLEPPKNWWLVAQLAMAMAYVPAGLLLVVRRGWRVLGLWCVVVGTAAIVSALATQYLGYTTGRNELPYAWGFASLQWAWEVVGASVLVTLLMFSLVPDASPSRPVRRAAMAASALAIGFEVVAAVTGRWPQGIRSNPIQIHHGLPYDVIQAINDAGHVAVGFLGAFAVALIARWWWKGRAAPDDPLPGWLLAGALVAWLAVVPRTIAAVGDRLPAPDVLQPMLLVATVPLVAIGAVIELVRDEPSGLESISHRFVEWILLATGIILIYTGVVAGFGRLVGGSSGPTWLLVGATGLIAVLVEPARRRVRGLADRLVYGSRDDPLALVRQVMDHVSSSADGSELLPALAASLGREMRLDLVAIDVATAGGWEPAARYGVPTAHTQQVSLLHRGEVVGRLTVGWKEAPSLRARDAAALRELAAPLALAVSWVRLASDLRRSSVAVVSAREEERRRLRRDLHDGLGPALTGISLGLRASIRKLERAGSDDAADPNAASLELLDRLADEIDAAVLEVKRIVRDLRPTALDQLGLVGAVSEFARTLDDTVQVHLELPRPETSLPAAVEVAVYRIVTEALTNVVRHAAAARCWLRIGAGDAVEIDVVDDGVGVRPGTRAGIGLTAMQERAHELGGTVTLSANPPHGTHLHVRLPAALP